MPKYTNGAMQNAIQAVESGEAVRETAAAYGIPYSTLSNITRKLNLRTARPEHHSRLSKPEDIQLKDWFLAQAALGSPPTNREIRDQAASIAATRGDLRPLNECWHVAFFKRFPELIKVGNRSPVDQRTLFHLNQTSKKPESPDSRG